MAFKADTQSAFTNNFSSTERREIVDGYVAAFGLLKEDGTPLTTNAEKAAAMVNHFVSELKRYRRQHIKDAQIRAISDPADIEIT